MAARKLIVVFGATGVQGGSVAKVILGDAKMKETWAVRGITRDVSKPSAKALQSLGAETVAADLNDVSSLKKALEGAYAVFAVTNFWETHSADVEMKQGKAIADAAKESGVQHFVWSSLLNVTELTKGALSGVTHFDSKANVEKYIRESGIPASFFLPGYYMSNLPASFRRTPPDNVYTLAQPIPASSPLPLLATAEDTGKFVKAILLNREKTLGKRIYGATDYYTLDEIVKEFREQFPQDGKGAKNAELPHEVWKGFLAQAGMSAEAQEELLQNMRLMPEYGYYGGDSLSESHSILEDKLTTWKDFMAKASAFAELK